MKHVSVNKAGSKMDMLVRDELQKIFDGTSDAIFLVEQTDKSTFRYIRSNPSHQRLTGLSFERFRQGGVQPGQGETGLGLAWVGPFGLNRNLAAEALFTLPFHGNH